jgi:hypothetical protein
VIVNHVSLLVAVHAQPAAVVTATVLPVVAVAASDWLVGLSVTAHEPAWFAVNATPPIVSVPVRAAPVFAAAL